MVKGEGLNGQEVKRLKGKGEGGRRKAKSILLISNLFTVLPIRPFIILSIFNQFFILIESLICPP